jgi:hypothetical protein
MAEAKKILSNVPSPILMTGSSDQVKENCRKLIETCAPGVGYVLAGGAAVDKGDDGAAYEYGTCRK